MKIKKYIFVFMYQKTTENGTSTILFSFIIFLFMNFILLPNMVKYVTTINAINILEERKKKENNYCE